MSTSTMFTGSSRYAADFQQIIQRAVQIASLPMTQLSQQQAVLSQKQAAYYSIDNKVNAVSTAIQSLTDALGSASYSTSLSDSTVASATIVDGAFEGTYAIDIISAGSYERAMSLDGLPTVTDPTSQNIVGDLAYTLTVAGVPKAINLTSNSLMGLAQAINQSGASVQATVVNVGTGAAPDYRLSLQSTGVGNIPIQLTGSTSGDVMTTLASGSEARYTVNGQPPGGVASSSRNVTIAPGVTVNLQKAGSTTVTVTRTTTAIQSALSSLVASYNAAVDELDQHRGQNSGVLKGESEIWMLASDLRNLVNYSSADNGIMSLAQLGLSFNDKGKLALDPSKLSTKAVDDIQTFFGDGSQTGFIKNARTVLNSIGAPATGSIQVAISSLTSQISQTGNRISAEQDRISLLQDSLNAKMAAADALVARLEQQASYFTNLFSAMQQNSQNRN